MNASRFGSGSWTVSNLGIILLMVVVLVNVLLLLERKTFNWVWRTFISLVHYHHGGGHGGMQADLA